MPILPKSTRPPWIKKETPKRDKEHDPFYDSTAWRKLSKMVAMEEPLCRECLTKGIAKEGRVTDHIVQRKLRPELSLDRSNLQRLCNHHHAIKSSEEGRQGK